LDNVPFWHADWMQQPEPPSWSILQMRTVPAEGGDTMFADLGASYQALSPAMREFLEGLTVTQELAAELVDSVKRSYAARRAAAGPEYEDVLRRLEPTIHPLVRRIPETGHVNYWMCELFTRRINELSPAESDTVLRYLFRHSLSPEYVIRWRWQPGDLAFWDQRVTLHRGVRDYPQQVRRSGCRASIGPAAPVAARTRS
jgi:taurine dioxygenase